MNTTPSDTKQKKAETTNNLAIAYLNRIHGPRAADIDKAIKLFEECLLVHTRSSYPADWARATKNLASAYYSRMNGSRSENLQQSMKHLENSQKVYIQKLHPMKWARLQVAISRVFRSQIELKMRPSTPLRMVLKHLQQAYILFVNSADHDGCAKCCEQAGRCNLVCNQLESAKNSFIQSIHHVQQLRSRIEAGMETKKRLAERWSGMYRDLVDVCVRLKEYEEAWKFSEAAKSRNLLDLLQSRLIKSALATKSLVDEYWELLTAVLREQNRLSARAAEQKTRLAPVDSKHLKRLQKELSEFMDKHVPDAKSILEKFGKIGSMLSTRVRRLLLRDADAVVEWFFCSLDSMMCTLL